MDENNAVVNTFSQPTPLTPDQEKTWAEILKLRAELEDIKSKQKWEAERIKIEEEKIRIEKRRTIWTALSVVVPLLLIAGTYYTSVTTQREQENAQWDLKAVDLVFSAPNTDAIPGRLAIMKQLFPERTARFQTMEKFDPNTLISPDAIRTEQKTMLLNMIAAHAGDRDIILQTWRELFPADTWIEPTPTPRPANAHRRIRPSQDGLPLQPSMPPRYGSIRDSQDRAGVGTSHPPPPISK